MVGCSEHNVSQEQNIHQLEATVQECNKCNRSFFFSFAEIGILCVLQKWRTARSFGRFWRWNSHSKYISSKSCLRILEQLSCEVVFQYTAIHICKYVSIIREFSSVSLWYSICSLLQWYSVYHSFPLQLHGREQRCFGQNCKSNLCLLVCGNYVHSV